MKYPATTQVLSAIVILAAVSSQCSGLSCAICNSLVDPDCDGSNAKIQAAGYMVNCSIGRAVGPDYVSVRDAQICWKQRQDIGDGRIIIDRTCGPALADRTATCYDRVGTKKIKVTYCLCPSNNCNAGDMLKAAAGFPVFAALLGMLCLRAAMH